MKASVASAIAVVALLACGQSSETTPSSSPQRAPARLAPGKLARIRSEQQLRVASARDRLTADRETLGLDAQTTFQLRGVHTDELGQTHARFEQRWNGVRVFGAELIAHTAPDGAALPDTTSVTKPSKIGTVPAIDVATAISIADDDVGRKGPWASAPRAELVLYPETRLVALRPPTPGRAPNAADYRRETVRTVLAWHVQVSLANPADGVKRMSYLVDARSGAVLKRWSDLQTATGLSQYAGSVNVPSDASGPDETPYALGRDGARGIVIRSAQGADHTGSTVPLVDADDSWGDGQRWDDVAPASSASAQTAAVDVAYGIDRTLAFFEDHLGRVGIDGAGAPVIAYVHFGRGYDNAFWDEGSLTFGDGSDPDGPGPLAGGVGPLTSLDIVAHEFSHGVTEHTAGLIYAGESGGLNEATSDIFAASVEFATRGASGNWLMGEQTDEVPLRDMRKPSRDGSSPDAWFPGIGDLDVHYSSGPMNRAFYFMADGASADPASDAHTPEVPQGFSGVGYEAASAIWYRALAVYLTPSSDYLAARLAAVRAAADLYGRASPEFEAVQNAFAGIAVGFSEGTFDDLAAPTVTASATPGARSVALAANAGDNGEVARVEFYVDDGFVGSDSSRPYSLEFAGSLGAGEHAVHVAAYDRSGNAASSPAAMFVVSQDAALRNPGFEEQNAADGWDDLTPNQMLFRGRPDLAFRGGGFAWLGGWGRQEVDAIEQAFAVPAGGRVSLSFQVNTWSDDAPTVPYDHFAAELVSASGAVLASHRLDNTHAAPWWRTFAFDLTPYAGQTIRIRFSSDEDGTSATSFYVDEVALDVGEVPVSPDVMPYMSGTAGSVTIGATMAPNGPIDSVSFSLDGNVIGSAIAPPYEVSFDTASLADGGHVLVACLAAGSQTTCSADVPVFVDNSATQVVENSSFEQQPGSGAPPWVMEGNASLYIGPAHSGDVLAGLVGIEVPSSLYQAVTLPAGRARLSFAVWPYFSDDPAGTREPLRVSIVTAAGSQVLATVPTMQSGDWQLVTADASAFAGQTVTLRFELGPVSLEHVGGTFVLLDDVELWRTAIASDTVPPRIDAWTSGDSGVILLGAEAWDEFVLDRVRISVDGSVIDELGTAGSVVILPVDASVIGPGAHVARFEAIDASGNTSSVDVSFEVLLTPPDLTPPVVTGAAAISGGFVGLAALATDDRAIASVEFAIDGVFVATRWSPPFTFTLPVTALSNGRHTLTVRAYDASANSATSTATFRIGQNHAPVAQAGPDVAVNEGVEVVLGGSGSDPDGEPLTYAWSQLGGPAVTLVNASSPAASFAAPAVTSSTTLTFELTVSDGELTSSDTVVVTVSDVRPPPVPTNPPTNPPASANRAPVASAGADVTVNEGTLVTLEGSANDPDADAITYAWTQLDGPAVTLANASSARATFTAPTVTAPGTLTFRLAVSDGTLSSSDTVVVTVDDVVVPPPPGPTPPSGSSGEQGGGGCSTGGGSPAMGLLALAALLPRLRRR